jgi:glutamine cyclotransferase
MMLRLPWLVGLLAALLLGPVASFAAIPVYGVRVVRAYPHDRAAFTEGLFYLDGWLYESTGQGVRPAIRKVELASGRVVQGRDIAPMFFGEGIVAWKNRLIELTWQNHIGFIYDLRTFQPLGSFNFPGEGWALTTDGRRIIMSDGTPQLRFLDPITLREIAPRLTVTADGAPVTNVNELEWVKGQIYANIWMTNRIARIDPTSGKVVGWIDLTGLTSPRDVGGDEDAVANGIAYDAARDRLFVTGKLWPKLFEIRLVRRR